MAMSEQQYQWENGTTANESRKEKNKYKMKIKKKNERSFDITTSLGCRKRAA